MELRIQYTIDARDLFRVALAQAKFRILLGLGFALTLISGLVAFFLTIDEGQVLLQTSPLFIGIPLLAVGGQVLRLHATSRKYVSNLSPSQRQTRFLFLDNADGIDIAFGESTSRISWSDVQKITEKQTNFLVFLNKYDVFVIPKIAVHDLDELQTLRTILAIKLGSRAQLLS